MSIGIWHIEQGYCQWPYKGRLQKKTVLCGNNSPVGRPPPPLPQYGNAQVTKKMLWFILRFGTLGAFLVFTKMLTFCDKVMGEPPLRDTRFRYFPPKENVFKG